MPLERKDGFDSSFLIPKTKILSLSPPAAAAPFHATAAPVAGGGGESFIPEYETGLCIIVRLLARFVEVSHKTAAEAEEGGCAVGPEMGMAHAMQARNAAAAAAAAAVAAHDRMLLQGYGSWLLYRASQVPRIQTLSPPLHCVLML